MVLFLFSSVHISSCYVQSLIFKAVIRGGVNGERERERESETECVSDGQKVSHLNITLISL